MCGWQVKLRKVQGLSAVSCTKTVKPMEMPFGMWIRVGPRNYALDGVQLRTCCTCPTVDKLKATQQGAAPVRRGRCLECTRWRCVLVSHIQQKHCTCTVYFTLSCWDISIYSYHWFSKYQATGCLAYLPSVPNATECTKRQTF